MNRWTALLAGVAVTLSVPAAAQSPIGDWIGTLDAGGTKLRLAVHIQRGPDGNLAGTLDSLDQRAFGVPLGSIVVEGSRLTFSVPVISGGYVGDWDEATMGWRGSWTQGGVSLSLALAPGGPPPEEPRAPEPLPANWEMPSSAEIASAIAARNAPRRGQGIVVGVLDAAGRRVVTGGPEGGTAFDGDTVFEIGSISKVFTALLLADMVNKGEVALEDPAEKYLPEGARMPGRGGRKITLRDLSTHVSGLPRVPDNMPYGDPADPYADYTEAMMLAFLDRYELTRDIGAQAEYSNLGVGLLGYLLGRAAGRDYEALLRERITGPLGMADTSVTLSAGQQARFAPGFDTFMQPAKPWRLPALVGAGGIRSTADDMLKFAAAALDPQSPIGPAMATALATRVDSGSPNTEQALGWQVWHPEPERTVVMHNGGTGGFRSALALEPDKRRAAVVLINSAVEPSATDLALHLLVGLPAAPTPPVPPPPPPPVARTEVTLPVAELDRVVGRYEFAPGVIFNVTREGTVLQAQRQGSATGPVLPIFAEAPLRFFWRAVNGAIEFTTDADGRVTGAVATFDGQTLTGKRLEP
jgi:CubicO group peptidase (beta-lactamase class C family)